MQTIRRRAASPTLAWSSAGPDYQYRVAIYDNDTGEKRTIYEGFQTECRLPPDFRLTPNLLAYRVETRPADQPVSYANWQEFTAIPRLGDDLETPADDLITAPFVRGAKAYRLVVRDARTHERLVEVMRREPAFLLPAGQLRNRPCELTVLSRIKKRWRPGGWRPVTPAMLAAAEVRANRLIELPRVETPRPERLDAALPPGRAALLAGATTAIPPAALIVTTVTAQPALAPEPEPASVADTQWWDGDGGGAVEGVAGRLEAHGLKGMFFLDVFAGEALGPARLKQLARRLTGRGHDLGLMVNPGPWSAVVAGLGGLTPDTLLERALALFAKAAGGEPHALLFGAGQLNEAMLGACARAGVRVVIGDEHNRNALPSWMRGRTTPFAALDGVVVIPSGLMLSTPAHVRDRVVRHQFSAGDALSANAARDAAAAVMSAAGPRLLVASIDPLSMLTRTTIRSPARADEWNESVRRWLPGWTAAGWERATDGFEVAEGFNEIKVDMAAAFMAGLAESGLACLDPRQAFQPPALRALCEPASSHEPLLEHRRGPRVVRRSAVRRYDNAYRLALKARA